MRMICWKSALLGGALSVIVAADLAPAWAATQTVNIQGFAFSPATVSINANDTVTWVQKDPVSHTATSTSSPRVWDSGLLSLNQSFSFQFTTAGNYPYFCSVHPYMKGSVAVALAANQPPVVQLTSPANGTVFKAPASVTITATATDPDGSVSQVEFLDGTASLGKVMTAPFTLTVTNLANGSHQLTAKATDNQGASTASAAVMIVVDAPPTVSLATPGNGAVFLLPATITLVANAADSDGTIDHVEFFNGTNSLGKAAQSPYMLTWTNVSPGTYVLTVAATDNQGLQTVSSKITVNVSGAAAYQQHNLVSDLRGLADNTDTNLLNPWGIAFGSSGPFWISANHSGLSTIYDSTGAVQTLVVTLPTPAGVMPPAAPTGIVFNSTTNFTVGPNLPARFIFATEDGTISGWNSGSNAVLTADKSGAGAVYKGLALTSLNGSNFLYAADFHNGKVVVFDANYKGVALPGSFSDPTIPAGYAPFGIQNIGTNLYVTYALQDSDKHDDVRGPGHGFVNIFDTAGNLRQRLVSGGPLNSPWGLALAPAGFAQFSGALLIGNFGDGRINAFDPASGAWLGSLQDANNAPISIEGLWGIKFGNGGRGGDGNRLYFTAGISGGGSLEDHGLFGSVSAVPVVRITSLVVNGPAVTISWAGGTGPYLLQRKVSLTDTNWLDALATDELYVTVPNEGATAFFRVVDKTTVIPKPFSVVLSGPSEVPAVNSSAAGVGLLSLEGTQLSYHVTFSGLSGGATAAHIHGPADAQHAAGVLVSLSGASGSSGALSGVVTLSADQVANLLAGMTYANIHTAGNPGGEIRGQIVPLRIPVNLSGSAEVPPVTTAASGSGWITLIGPQMFYDIDYGGLSGGATAAHVHGPADATHAAGVLFGLAGASGTDGTLFGQQTLSSDQLISLLAGMTYVNIHTPNNPGGEIRGQVRP